MSYCWDALLEEWYVNDTGGLEHGYTVHQRPARKANDTASPLAFTLAVRGGLSPQITDDQRGVRFVDAKGGTALTYTGLTVFDADGKDVPARFEQHGGLLRLLVEEADARYPLNIDPVAQQAYLKASNTDADDNFGCSVSISGDTVVVGAYGEDSNATGVNHPNQGDNSVSYAGAAYVFKMPSGCKARSQTVGFGCIAKGQPPSLSVSRPVQGYKSEIFLSSLAPKKLGVVLLGLPHTGIPLGSGCMAYFDIRLPTVPVFFTTDASESWLSPPILVGYSPALTCSNIGLQAAVDDLATAPFGMALSNGVWITIGN
jgi:hypothetical protein